MVIYFVNYPRNIFMLCSVVAAAVIAVDAPIVSPCVIAVAAFVAIVVVTPITGVVFVVVADIAVAAIVAVG
jgi:hypothetical protein